MPKVQSVKVRQRRAKKAPTPSRINIPPWPEAEHFEQIAEIITLKPPPWLSEHLMSWSSSLMLDLGLQARQPKRAEMVQILAAILDAAGVLQRALGVTTVREFLDAGGDDGRMNLSAHFQTGLREIQACAERALKLPNLVNEKGQPKPGRGRALLDGAFSPQVFCVLIISEAWRRFHGRYPPPKNMNAARAADLYWRLSGGERKGWGGEPLNAWRYHLREARAVEAESLRAEIRRHLEMSEQAASMIAEV